VAQDVLRWLLIILILMSALVTANPDVARITGDILSRLLSLFRRG
jgi:hypothetical protein